MSSSQAEISCLDSHFNATHSSVKVSGQYIASADDTTAKEVSAIKSNTEPNVVIGQDPSALPLLAESGKVVKTALIAIITTLNGLQTFTQIFLGVPLEIGEAARIDGASEWRIFLWVYRPLADDRGVHDHRFFAELEHLALQLGQSGTKAGVDAVPEGEALAGIAVDVEGVRVGEPARVVAGGRQRDLDLASAGDGDTADLDILGRERVEQLVGDLLEPGAERLV